MAFWKWPVTNSTIHKATGLSAAIQNGLWKPFLLVAPIHTQWDIFQWNGGIVPGKVASGFVNSTVTALFTKPVASWFPAVP